MKRALSLAYRFKPGRTFAQALAGAMGTSPLTGVDWPTALSVAGAAGGLSFLMIWSEGGDMLAADQRVTGTKPGWDDAHDVFDDQP